MSNIASFFEEQSGKSHQIPLRKLSILTLVALGETINFEELIQHIINYLGLLVHSANVKHEYMSFFV